MTQMDAELDRHLVYERVFNLRDLGGYEAADGRSVRWRTLFRGDGVHRLAHDAFVELGVRTALDLRTPYEIEERGRIDADGVAWYHLPVLKTVWDPALMQGEAPPLPERFLADRYLVMLEEGAESLGTALRILADPAQLPAMFHCAAGKDRTGVLAALMLSLLGVDDETVAHDYGLSRLGMDRMVEYIRVTYPERFDAMADQPAAFRDAPEDAMRLFLADLRQAFGSAEGYAESVGAGPDVVAALRATLLQ
ncbi:MAG: tyrosine-protein phosphatase [Acidimicrobiales bacterium]